MVALGALPGAQAGAAMSHRMPESWLKQALLWIVALSAARVWWDVFAR
jgi:uncharacterized membrane protein YfcA